MEYIAFISHSNKDAKALHAVREHLESCGFACFASERDLLHNAGWQAQLVEAMDASRMLVYIHSRNSNESAEVGREINYFADKCHRPILVYRLDDVPYNRDRAYYLQSINYIDSLLNPSDGLEQLADNVRHTLEGQMAEGYEKNPGKAVIMLRKIAIPLVVLALLAGGGIGFHLWEKGKAGRLQEEGAAALSRVDGWLSREDSLELVMPGIDEAEALYGQCSGLLTVKAPEPPDFQGIRESSRQVLEEIRDRRINTVKALYEPLRFASKKNIEASAAVIASNIERIAVLDSLLGLPLDKDIELIMNSIKSQ
jgi:hypothetical protein